MPNPVTFLLKKGVVALAKASVKKLSKSKSKSKLRRPLIIKAMKLAKDKSIQSVKPSTPSFKKRIDKITEANPGTRRAFEEQLDAMRTLEIRKRPRTLESIARLLRSRENIEKSIKQRESNFNKSQIAQSKAKTKRAIKTLKTGAKVAAGGFVAGAIVGHKIKKKPTEKQRVNIIKKNTNLRKRIKKIFK